MRSECSHLPFLTVEHLGTTIVAASDTHRYVSTYDIHFALYVGPVDRKLTSGIVEPLFALKRKSLLELFSERQPLVQFLRVKHWATSCQESLFGLAWVFLME